MKYVDGFVIPVPRKKLAAYARLARKGRAIFLKHGALDYQECVGDDLANGMGATFPGMLKLSRGETVVFSYVVYRSRAHRDKVNAAMMAEMEKLGDMEMPFDVKRVVYGGLKVLVGI